MSKVERIIIPRRDVCWYRRRPLQIRYGGKGNANDYCCDTQGCDAIACAIAHTIKMAHVLVQTNDTEHCAPQYHKDTTPMALLPEHMHEVDVDHRRHVCVCSCHIFASNGTALQLLFLFNANVTTLGPLHDCRCRSWFHVGTKVGIRFPVLINKNFLV